MSSRSAGAPRVCSSTTDGVGATPTSWSKQRGRRGTPALVSGRRALKRAAAGLPARSRRPFPSSASSPTSASSSSRSSR
jgi:hypothetical protein